MINPISVTRMQNQSKPGHEHRHSGSGSQFDTNPTGIGLNRAKTILQMPIPHFLIIHFYSYQVCIVSDEQELEQTFFHGFPL